MVQDFIHQQYDLQSKLFRGEYLGYIGDYIIGVVKGDTRSVDRGSYGALPKLGAPLKRCRV